MTNRISRCDLLQITLRYNHEPVIAVQGVRYVVQGVELSLLGGKCWGQLEITVSTTVLHCTTLHSMNCMTIVHQLICCSTNIMTVLAPIQLLCCHVLLDQCQWAASFYPKQGTYSLSSYLSRSVCSLGELLLLGLKIFVRPNTWKTQKSTSSYRQDMELCMTAIPYVTAR